MRPDRFAPLAPGDAGYLLAEVGKTEPDWLLPLPYVAAEVRGAWLAVLAFAAELTAVPARVSNPTLGQIRLAWWREARGEVFGEGTPRRHPVVLALALTVGGDPKQRAVLGDLIDGMDAFLAPGDDRTIDEAVAARRPVHGALARSLALLEHRGRDDAKSRRVTSGDETGTGLALHSLSGLSPDRLAVPGEGGVEPMAKRFARALGRDPGLEAALAARIREERAAQAGQPFLLANLPLALVDVRAERVRLERHPFARRWAIFRAVLTGRV